MKKPGVPKFDERLRGFTLLELIVVVAIIALMATLIWPSLSTAMDRNQLSNAAKQLRSELAQTRLQAIESGTPLQFRYLPGENRYEIKPAEFGLQQPFKTGEPDSEEVPQIGDLQEEMQSSSSEKEIESKTLPDGVRFREKFVFRDPNEEFTDEFSEDGEKVPNKESLKEESISEDESEDETDDEETEVVNEWSEPIIFFPNGRTANARIELVGRSHFRIELTIRGLTGAVKLGKIQRSQ